MKINFFQRKISFICTFILIIIPFKVYALQDDTDFLDYLFIIEYAGDCAKKLKVEEDSKSKEELQKFYANLKNLGGVDYYSDLARNEGRGGREAFFDRGSRCVQMLLDAIKIYKSFGMEGEIYLKALTILIPPEKILKNKNIEHSDISEGYENFKLTDKLHNQFLIEDNDYARANALLNATWKMIRKNLDRNDFASIQNEQRKWLSQKRDKMAAVYASTIPLSKAYVKVMEERIFELSSIIAKEPHIGDYSNDNNLFNIFNDKGEYHIDGSADSPSGNTCLFAGKITKDNGWYKVHEDGFPPYYILFTDKGAMIEYLGDGSNYGCGYGVDFKGEYTHMSR